jgi:hypothetical protein
MESRIAPATFTGAGGRLLLDHFAEGAQITVAQTAADTLSIRIAGDAWSGTGAVPAGVTANGGSLTINSAAFAGAVCLQNCGGADLGLTFAGGAAPFTNALVVQSTAGDLAIAFTGGASTFSDPAGLDVTATGTGSSVSDRSPIVAAGNVHMTVAGDITVGPGGGIALASPGRVRLQTGVTGSLEVAGAITAVGGQPNQTGGSVQLLGGAVNLEGAAIDVSGTAGGGTVQIGGPEALTTTIDAASIIRADATDGGAGGQVSVWSEDATRFAGTISARGGTAGGAGGQADVSGHGTLAFQGAVNLGAPLGQGGTLRLDPIDFTVDNTNAPGLVATLNSNTNVVISTNGAGVAAGNVTIDAPLDYSSTAFFGVLAQGNIRVNGDIQNTGTGDVALVAGWDGVTQAPAGNGIQPGATFDFATLTATAGAFGNNNGSIFIGDGTQARSIAVGSRFGATDAAGFDLALRGSDNAAAAMNQRFVQLGFRADQAAAGFNIAGTINVQLADNLIATAGSQDAAYAQVGHGGLNFSFDINNPPNPAAPGGSYGGNITISTPGDLLFTSGLGNASYAQLGNGGYAANSTNGGISGDISISRARNLTFTAASGNGSYAQLGDGGYFAFAGDSGISGAITLGTVNDLAFSSAAGGTGSYVQLGDGGASDRVSGNTSGGISGAITINQAHDVSFTAGSNPLAYAQVGDSGSVTITTPGTPITTGGINGAITIGQANNLTFTAGAGDSAYTQLGDFGGVVIDTAGGAVGTGGISGDIAIRTAANLTFAAGAGSGAYAQLGNSGTALIGTAGGAVGTGGISGNIAIGTAADLTFTAGAGGGAYAQLGTGGLGSTFGPTTIAIYSSGGPPGAPPTRAGGNVQTGGMSGDINIGRANDLLFTAGGGGNAYVQLGTGGANDRVGISTGGASNTSNGNVMAGGIIGAITITQANNVTFAAGGGRGAFADLGTGGLESGATIITTAGLTTTDGDVGTGGISGAIGIGTAGNLTFTGGAGKDAFAQLGTGGSRSGGAISSAGSITTGGTSGAITITQANNLTFTGGAGQNALAQLGTGGSLEIWNIASFGGAITTGGMGNRAARLSWAAWAAAASGEAPREAATWA